MKLVFAKEMQSLDQQSAEQIGLPTMVLMENAGKAVAETAADFLEDCFGKNIVVFTGKGNNGGDGFAAARWRCACCCAISLLFSAWSMLVVAVVFGFSFLPNLRNLYVSTSVVVPVRFLPQ